MRPPHPGRRAPATTTSVSNGDRPSRKVGCRSQTLPMLGAGGMLGLCPDADIVSLRPAEGQRAVVAALVVADHPVEHQPIDALGQLGANAEHEAKVIVEAHIAGPGRTDSLADATPPVERQAQGMAGFGPRLSEEAAQLADGLARDAD